MRFLGMVLCVFALTVGQVQAQPVPPPVAAQFAEQSRLLEHLVKHSDQLLTEINLVRAGLFRISQPLFVALPAQSPWLRRYIGEVLVVPQGVPVEQGTPDYIIGIQANNFRLSAIGLYESWQHKKVYGPASPAFANQFPVTMQLYYNAMSATYFYIEALRRTYLIQRPFTTCYDAQLLTRRLIKLERLAFEIRELMHMIRHTAAFGLRLGNNCIECRYGSIRINVEAKVEQTFVPFPYYSQNQVWVPKTVDQRAPVDNFQPSYDVKSWNQRWDYIDQGYLQGYQNNVPNSTPVNPPGREPLQQFNPGGVQPPGQTPQNPFQGNPQPLNPQTRPTYPPQGGGQYPSQGGQPQFPGQGGQPQAPGQQSQFPGQGGQPQGPRQTPQYPGQGGQYPQTQPGRPQYPTQPPVTQPTQPANPGEDVVPYRDFNG